MGVCFLLLGCNKFVIVRAAKLLGKGEKGYDFF